MKCSRPLPFLPRLSAFASKQEALIFNYESHWFAVRKLSECWLNMDSMLARPLVWLASGDFEFFFYFFGCLFVLLLHSTR